MVSEVRGMAAAVDRSGRIRKAGRRGLLPNRDCAPGKSSKEEEKEYQRSALAEGGWAAPPEPIGRDAACRVSFSGETRIVPGLRRSKAWSLPRLSPGEGSGMDAETRHAASLPSDPGRSAPHLDDALSPSIPAPPRGRLCCANLRPRARSRATSEPCCGRA